MRLRKWVIHLEYVKYVNVGVQSIRIPYTLYFNSWHVHIVQIKCQAYLRKIITYHIVHEVFIIFTEKICSVNEVFKMKNTFLMQLINYLIVQRIYWQHEFVTTSPVNHSQTTGLILKVQYLNAISQICEFSDESENI